jgi:hypothetical protein
MPLRFDSTREGLRLEGRGNQMRARRWEGASRPGPLRRYGWRRSRRTAKARNRHEPRRWTQKQGSACTAVRSATACYAERRQRCPARGAKPRASFPAAATAAATAQAPAGRWRDGASRKTVCLRWPGMRLTRVLRLIATALRLQNYRPEFMHRHKTMKTCTLHALQTPDAGLKIPAGMQSAAGSSSVFPQ